MVSEISSGVRVTVETSYQQEYSNPLNGEFIFAYRITLENNNNYPVKLLSRHWHIFDSNGTTREVEGEGVIGVQPLISSGETYQYVSGCNLRSEIGRMHGTYLFEDVAGKRNFEVVIPAFMLIAPLKMN